VRLSGKVAVVTGAALGMGRAVASRFAREGAIVVAADTNEGEGQSLALELKGAGLEASFIRTDVSKADSVKALFDEVLNKFHRVDVLYNNAAVLFADRDALLHELTPETWDCVMNVNLRGYFLCARCAILSMLQNSGGSIINVGSPTGIVGCAPNLTAYSTSKAGVLGLTRVMAAGYARKQIRVNTIIPGTMCTPMNGVLLSDETRREEYREAVPLGRLGQAEDVEGLAVFLASDESSYCTGGIFMCDGGLTAV
jgi:NAD(P)-dependent dehydrogenase (short-subunit alcohol dehydrogenase family)